MSAWIDRYATCKPLVFWPHLVCFLFRPIIPRMAEKPQMFTRLVMLNYQWYVLKVHSDVDKGRENNTSQQTRKESSCQPLVPLRWTSLVNIQKPSLNRHRTDGYWWHLAVSMLLDLYSVMWGVILTAVLLSLPLRITFADLFVELALTGFHFSKLVSKVLNPGPSIFVLLGRESHAMMPVPYMPRSVATQKMKRERVVPLLKSSIMS